MEKGRFGIFAGAFSRAIPSGAREIALPAPCGSAAAFIAAAAALPARVVFAVAPGLPEADVLFGDLEALSAESGVRVLEFPPELEDDPAAAGARIRTAAALEAWAMRPYPLVVATSRIALDDPAPDAADAAARTVRFETGKTFDGGPAAAAEKLSAAGYSRTEEVCSPLEFAVRGGILDVWALGGDKPFRVEFAGDEAESIRVFDPATQDSTGKTQSAAIPPAACGAKRGRPVTSIPPPGAAAIVWFDHNAYVRPADLPQAALELYTGDPAPRGVPSAQLVTVPLPGLAEARAEIARDPQLLDSVRGALERHLEAAEKRGEAVFRADDLSGGFELPGAMAVVAKSDRMLVPRRSMRRALPDARAGRRLSAADSLQPGELVVHIDHGIGRFLGSSEIETDGKRCEVFTVEYADGAKLHVPAAQAHVLSRYVGVKGETVKLHKLGGGRWLRDKAAAQRSVQDLASTLLGIQARRSLAKGFAYDISPPGFDIFEASFPFAETEDQLKAFSDVARDMASDRPMDRLVCGDAGYGKTEVAMRAACIAALNGKQTVVLAPTTVLAQQHFETFSARFDGLPIRVEAVSRAQSPAARQGAFERLAAGSLDIAVGTHALLSHRVKFKDLGLVIIDEEQRFGVAHKEFLKKLRVEADFLTLSATPIPRTLHLAMTGVRDLSLLRTPPQDRVPVETAIARDTDATVQSAIRAELARGGQTYYLYNRVKTISFTLERIRRLVPEARVTVAHGQMDARELAARMAEFSNGDSDILLCTTIAENGLDIPRANTIIVDRADRFGLAELYQLRGRVGRGPRRGKAVFLIPAEGALDSDARERLDALKRHSGLGAGFGIALRDLEIRGAGNILGREQSGHIAAVGFELYCQLLRRTVAEMRGEAAPDAVEASVNLDFADMSPGVDGSPDGVCLPYSYVEDESHRVELHRKLAEAASPAEVRRLRKSVADRFGPLPQSAVRLLRVAELRILCSRDGIMRLETKNGRAFFYRDNSRSPVFAGDIKGKSADRKISSLFNLEAKAAAKLREPRLRPDTIGTR